ncbi:MAG TPA: DUF3800 domain-containing protein [Pirellulales bacterium]|nr:DUF3800 domain-containing protein [Pirellulales bacterium]
MSAASFVVYVDESGDEGFVFPHDGQGSSKWFVLAAVVTRKPIDLETVKLVDTVRADLGYNPKKPLHFREMKHEHRLPYVQRIADARLRCVCVLIHKPAIQDREKFRERFRLYFYATRLLLERVSWLCRDRRVKNDPGDGSAEIIFSNRGGTSYAEMRRYFDRLRQRSAMDDVRIDWSVIDTRRVIAAQHDQNMGLQVADAVATSFFFGVEPTKQGFTEPRYATMLQAVVYRHKGSARGHGVKLWPRDVIAKLATEPTLEWMRDVYQ